MSGPGSGAALYFDDHIAYKRRLRRRPEATLLTVSFTNLEYRNEAAGGATSTPPAVNMHIRYLLLRCIGSVFVTQWAVKLHYCATAGKTRE
jgi:hypothetical protein